MRFEKSKWELKVFVEREEVEEILSMSEADQMDMFHAFLEDILGFGRVLPEEVGALTESELWSETVVRNDAGVLLAVGLAFWDREYQIMEWWRRALRDGEASLYAERDQDAGTSPLQRYWRTVDAFAAEVAKQKTDVYDEYFVNEYCSTWVSNPDHAIDALAYGGSDAGDEVVDAMAEAEVKASELPAEERLLDLAAATMKVDVKVRVARLRGRESA